MKWCQHKVATLPVRYRYLHSDGLFLEATFSPRCQRARMFQCRKQEAAKCCCRRLCEVFHPQFQIVSLGSCTQIQFCQILYGDLSELNQKIIISFNTKLHIFTKKNIS